jgi:hypothetical protein
MRETDLPLKLHVTFQYVSFRQACWMLPGIRIVVIIESCRRLLKDERYAYEATKTHVAYQKRHLLPSVQALRSGIAKWIRASHDTSITQASLHLSSVVGSSSSVRSPKMFDP